MENDIAYGNDYNESRIISAEGILYNWACGHYTEDQTVAMLKDLLFEVDLRQPCLDNGNVIKAYDWLQEEHVNLEI